MSGPNLLIGTAEFGALRSRDPVPLGCLACGATFERPKHLVQVALKGTKGHTHEFCSKSCKAVSHGDARRGRKTADWRCWSGMIRRCEEPQNKCYANYGGRGIKVCERWRNDYATFLADMGRKPSSRHSIDRIDNDGDYEPSNCRWATNSEQQKNKRPN